MPTPDDRSDVYALGVVMWEVATRQLPFSAGRPLVDVALDITSGRRPPLPFLPPLADSHAAMYHCGNDENSLKREFVGLIEMCWHQEPERRPSLPRLLDQLEYLLSEETFAAML